MLSVLLRHEAFTEMVRLRLVLHTTLVTTNDKYTFLQNNLLETRWQKSADIIRFVGLQEFMYDSVRKKKYQIVQVQWNHTPYIIKTFYSFGKTRQQSMIEKRRRFYGLQPISTTSTVGNFSVTVSSTKLTRWHSMTARILNSYSYIRNWCTHS